MILYFSATGNCLDVAKRLASSLDEKLYDVAVSNKNGEYSFEKAPEEGVGLVIPVYYGGIPLPVSEFLGKFSCGNDLPYVYAVFTYGGSIGGADYRLKKLLDKVNIPLHAVYGVKCPDNFLPLFNPEDEETCKKLEVYATEFSVPMDLMKSMIFRTNKTKFFSNTRILRESLRKAVTQQWLQEAELVNAQEGTRNEDQQSDTL